MSDDVMKDALVKAREIAESAPAVLDDLLAKMNELGEDCTEGIRKLAGSMILGEVISRMDILKKLAEVCTTFIHLECDSEVRLDWVVARDRLESNLFRAHLMMHDFARRTGHEAL